MKGLTIAKLMILVALVAGDAWLVRRFVVDGMFAGLVFVVPTLQVGYWRLRRARGRRRRFWAGFEAGGLLAIIGLLLAEIVPRSAPSVLLNRYVGWSILCRYQYLSESTQDIFEEHEDWFFALVYYLPALVATMVGGSIAASFWRRSADDLPMGRGPSAS